MQTTEPKTASVAKKNRANQPFFHKTGEGSFFGSGEQVHDPFFHPAACYSLNGNGIIQTRLSVGPPNDKYEQEADAVADKVVQRLAAPEPFSNKETVVQAKPLANSITKLVQTKCAACEPASVKASAVRKEEKLQMKEEEDVTQETPLELQMKPVIDNPGLPPEDEENIQRKCTECRKEEKILPKQDLAGQKSVSPGIESSLSASKGGGFSLTHTERKQMESSFGADFSNVRLHTDSSAVQMSKDLHAKAFTHGSDIYFNSGKFDTNSTRGKHLLAHELTHVVQQTGSTNLKSHLVGQDTQKTGRLFEKNVYKSVSSNVVQCKEEQDYVEIETVVVSVIDAMSEINSIAGVGNVDKAFGILNKYSIPFLLRVLVEVYDRGYFHGLLGYLAPGTKANNIVIVAIRLIQCQKEPEFLKLEEIDEAIYYIMKLNNNSLPRKLKSVIDCLLRERVRKGIEREKEHAPRKGPKSLTYGMMDWWLVPLGYSKYRGDPSARIQIMFTPKPAYKGKTITFLQTVLQTTSSESMKSKSKPSLDILRDEFDPFYGADFSTKKKKWVAEGGPEGYKNAPSSKTDSTAYLYDAPSVPPTQTKMFESVAVIPETGEQLGALRWGVRGDKNKGDVFGAESKDCTDNSSAEFRAAIERFYGTPEKLEFKGVPPGEERYARILDGFIANDATLSARHQSQLEPVADQLKLKKFVNMRAKLGGFADASETMPFRISEQRADTVKSYLIGKGVPKEKIEVVGFGSTWVRYPSSNKENRNRRVQILLYFP